MYSTNVNKLYNVDIADYQRKVEMDDNVVEFLVECEVRRFNQGQPVGIHHFDTRIVE
uniref:Acetyltransferase n=1 Tax=Ascaris lumbricoides TaxID=6252 RepID=A0A0M3IGS9_ASCLU